MCIRDRPSADWWDYAQLGEQCRAYAGYAVVNAGDRLDRTAQLKPMMYLRGMEQTYVDLALNPDVAEAICAGTAHRFGLITTNAIKQTFNRRIVQAALDKGLYLTFAIPDHPWSDAAEFAAVRIAVDLVNEGLISKTDALSAKRIPADDLNQLLQPIYEPKSKRDAVAAGRLLAKGINAGPGAASGQIVFHASDAEAQWLKDNKVQLILVRRETSPEDLRGMQIAQGILTAFGSASSHAALVSRQMGKACIVGCGDLNIDYQAGTLTVNGKVFKAGDSISIDGFTGEVFEGTLETHPSEILQVLISKTMKPEEDETFQRYEQLMKWVDEHRKLRVRTNADEPKQALEAIAFGAEGIGLCLSLIHI